MGTIEDHALRGHVHRVTALAFSPDSKLLATGADDESVKIWDVASRKILQTFEIAGWRGDKSITFMSNGRGWAVAGTGQLFLCFSDGEVIHRHLPPDSENVYLLSGDQYLLVDAKGRISLWHWDGWSIQSSFVETFKSIEALILTPDESQLAIVDRCGLTLLDLETGATVWKSSLVDHRSWRPCFSRDGTLLRLSNGYSSSILFETATGTQISDLAGESVSFYSHGGPLSPNGRILAEVDDYGTVEFRDAETGELLRSLVCPGVQSPIFDPSTGISSFKPAAHDGWVTSTAFAPDGRIFASGGYDHVVRLWEVESGRFIDQLGRRRNYVKTLALSADEQMLVAGYEDGSLRVWNVSDGAVVSYVMAHTNALSTTAVSAERVITGCVDGSVKAWTFPNLELLHCFAAPEGIVISAAISKDGQWAVLGGHFRGEFKEWSDVFFWNVESAAKIAQLTDWKEASSIDEHGFGLYSMALSPDDSILAIGMGKQCQAWCVESGELSHRFLTGDDNVFDRVLSLAFSPDGRLLAAGTVGFSVFILDVATGLRRLEFSAKQDSLCSLAFSPDGKSLAICGDYGNHLGIHDVKTGKPLTQLRGHSNNLRCVAWARNGLLATGGCDGFIKLWRDGRVERTLIVEETK